MASEAQNDVELGSYEQHYEVLGWSNRCISPQAADMFHKLRTKHRLRDKDHRSVEGNFLKVAKDSTLKTLPADEQVDVLERIVLGVQQFPNVIDPLERHCNQFIPNVSKERLAELAVTCKCARGFDQFTEARTGESVKFMKEAHQLLKQLPTKSRNRMAAVHYAVWYYPMIAFFLRKQYKHVVKCGRKCLAAIHYGLAPIDVREHTLVRCYWIMLTSYIWLNEPSPTLTLRLHTTEALKAALDGLAKTHLHPLARGDVMNEIALVCLVLSRPQGECIKAAAEAIQPDAPTLPCMACGRSYERCPSLLLEVELEQRLLLPHRAQRAFLTLSKYHLAMAERLENEAYEQQVAAIMARAHRDQADKAASVKAHLPPALAAVKRHVSNPLYNQGRKRLAGWLSETKLDAHGLSEDVCSAIEWYLSEQGIGMDAKTFINKYHHIDKNGRATYDDQELLELMLA
eukprot:TRINITY_DN10579_c0_g1_i1.p1 TRINITY_DN10579_c0_g1~~TRINITY_DN10579_c0_g1_i1.p1  ORF type:complete len:458 (+),score=91.02 TRINITY_DN10579_c0_g1_i1:1370-2743(+)